MAPRFPLKRTTSVDTIETVHSEDSIDLDTRFVDRMCSKVKKVASTVIESRGRVLLTAILRPGNEENRKEEKCERSIYSIDTMDIDDQIEAIVRAENNRQDRDDDQESGLEYDDDYEEETSCNEGLMNNSELLAKRRINRRIRYDSKCRRRENGRRSARETAATLIRERTLKEHASGVGSARKLHHRHSDSRQHRRGRIVYDVARSQ